MALADSLVAHYSLGNLNDNVGSNHLTNVNGVTFNTGIVGDGAYFASASGQYLSIADNADLSMGDIDFTLACWLYLTDRGSYRFFLAKDGNESGALREYGALYDPDNQRINFFVQSSGFVSTAVAASNFGLPPTATWLYVVMKHDSVNNLISIKVNDGTANTAAHSAGVRDGTSAFSIGGRVNSNPFPLNGRADEVGVWKRLTTDSEDTELYNGGSGRDYAYIVGGGGEEEEEAPLVYYAPMLSFGIGIGVN